MRRKQLLFSKREKNEKATGMGDENENQEGNLGLPNNNSQQSENTNNNNKNKNTESKNNENKTQIEKVSNEVFNKEKIKIKSIKDLNKEADELFNETLDLVRELKPIKIHAFPYSPRPGTVAAVMPNQIPRNISKARVHKITKLAIKNMSEYMATCIGKCVSCLVENNNIARTPDDIDVVILGTPILPRTICNIKLNRIENGAFVGEKVL